MKPIAAILIILAGYFAGSAIASSKKLTLDCMTSVLGLVEHMKAKITYSNLPLVDIILSYENQTLSDCDFFVSYKKEKNGNDGWKRGIRELPLSPVFRAACLAFGDTLGLLPREGQLNKISMLLSELEKEVAAEKKDNGKRQKAYRSLGLLCGLLCVIILI